MGATSFSGGHTVDTGAVVGSTTPSTQAHGDSAASGSSAEAARVDHKHAMPAAGGVSQAGQSAIEAETNEDTYAPPDLIKHSPGVAKFWVAITGSDGAVDASYNLTSVTRGSTGVYPVTYATDFAAATHMIVGQVSGGGGGNQSTNCDTPSDGAGCIVRTYSGSAAADFDSNYAAFGAQ